ncbi:MAG: FlgD immunoglobulin-like domain containing protein, partial [Fidelibacterota bacterium]
EIHRSQTPGVTTASPLLVSISEIDTVHFIDTNPPQGDVYYKLFVMDASSNILADYGEVYVNTTAGSGGIDVTIASSATTSGLLMVGLMNPGVDANYWNNRDRDWALGSFNFPGNYQFNLADNSPDGNDYHLMAFVDLDGDSILNDASEAFGISNSFNIAGGYGNAGQVNLDFGGSSNGFNVTVDLQEDYPFGQLYVALYKEGDNPDVVSPLHQEQVGVDPPFNQNIFIPQALPEDKQYFLAGFFDVNGNMMPDTDEPVGQSGLFSYPPTGEIFLHLERMIGPEIDTTGVSFLSAEEGTNIDISTEVFSTNGVDRVELHYWSGNTGVVRVLNMNRATGDIWEVTIPSNDVTTAGLVVSVMAWDSRDVVNSTAWFDVPVYFYSLKFATTSPEEYQMISVPGDLDERSLSAVLEPALGKQDPTKWRIFQWNGSDYSENNGDFGPFQAFWIITREASSLRTKSGQTIPLTKQLRVDLAYGWNMVGLPVNFPVDIDAVTVTKNGGIEPLLYEWDGSSYTTTNTFTPGSGYWIYSNSAGWLGFDFVGAAASQGSGKALVSDDGPGWQANLTAGIGKYRDRLNTFGVHQEALDGKDSRDFHEPPVIGNYISIAFENEDWNPSDGGYSVDIKSPATDVKTWKLATRSNLKGIATITLDDPGQIPPQDGVWLVDQTQGIAYDLRKDQRITFASPGNDKPYSFLLLVGERSALGQQMEQLNLVPDRFELAQNTPNPFNPVTTIGISLTKDAVVTLRVFNVLGQELNVLALNKPMAKGKHRFIWAGKDSHGNQLPSGVYLYRLEIKNNFDQVMFGDTKKMLLVK